jgi:hypothetical protein
MRFTHYFPDFAKTESEVIASFGEAQLIKTLDCKYELRGGTRADHTAAREWISMFMHDVVIREVAPR